jgi:hypothetical protein
MESWPEETVSISVARSSGIMALTDRTEPQYGNPNGKAPLIN